MTLVASPAVADVAIVYKTLGELVRECQIRLGQGAQGANGGVNVALIKSHLDDAQFQLYNDFHWQTLIRYKDVTLGTGEIRIDYPSFMNAERLLQAAVNIGTGTENWVPIKPGIQIEHYNTQANPTYPRRMEQYDQIEFWPQADRVYTVRIWGIKALPRFTEDGDRCLIDDHLVRLFALATLKAHYNQKDAQTVGNQVERLRLKLRGNSWKQRTFDGSVGSPATPDWEPLAKPVVINR